MPKKICDEPLDAEAVDGGVHVTGGCGVDVTLTAPAAMDTGDAIFDAASTAFSQQRDVGQADEPTTKKTDAEDAHPERVII